VRAFAHLPVQHKEHAMSASGSVPARPAAAVVLLRDRLDGGIEVFLVRRHIRSEFVPDAFVFPGGTVKPADAEIERSGCCASMDSGPAALGTGFRAAALRECFEEAGVLLARRGGEPLAVLAGDVARFASYREGLNARTLTLAEVAAQESLTLATNELLHWA